MRATELAQHLAKRAKELCEQLLPNGVAKGDEYIVGSIGDETGKSLNICLSGDKAGCWHDFSTDEKGDLIGLIQAVQQVGLVEACLFAQKFLGIHEDKFSVSSERKVFKKPQLSNYHLNNEVADYLQSRKIPLEIIKRYKIISAKDYIIFPYYNLDGEIIYDKGLKIARPNGKKQIHSTKDCKPILFGWQAIDKSARSISICEGEIDALSLAAYGYNALSVPTGATGTKWIEYEYDNLASYDEIFIVYDNDDAGRLAVKEVAERLGAHKCRIVKLPKKDANECLQANIPHEKIANCYVESGYIQPSELKIAKEFMDETIAHLTSSEEQQGGYTLPFPKLRNKIWLREDELSIWSGINGHGKSQVLGQLCLHLIAQGVKVCVASLEIKPKRLLGRMIRQATCVRQPTVGYIKKVFNDFFAEKLWIFELVGTAKVDRLLAVLEYARKRFYITHFIIDSMMKLDIEEEDYKREKAVISALADFKNKFNCHIHLVAHPRKQMNESVVPDKMAVKGSGSITNNADNSFVVWRNKDKEKKINILIDTGQPIPPEIQQEEDGSFTCNKARNGEYECRLPLWFHQTSLQFTDSYYMKPTPYVDYEEKLALDDSV